MDEIHVLAIVPYDEMGDLIKEIASAYSGLHVTSLTRIDALAANFTTIFPDDQFDIILARGGTYRVVRSVTETPVIEIPISFYDLLRVMIPAVQFAEKVAVVSFPYVCQTARYLCAALNLPISVYEFEHQQYISEVVEKLADDGYELIIGGLLTKPFVENLGLQFMPIANGRESLTTAVENAITQYKNMQRVSQNRDFFRKISDESDTAIVVFNEDNEVFYRNRAAYQLIGKSGRQLEKQLIGLIPSMKEKSIHVFRKLESGQYEIYGNKLNLESNYYSFQFFFRSPSFKSFSVVSTESHTELSAILHDHPCLDLYFRPFIGFITKLSETESPVLIQGEVGTQKGILARLIHYKNPKQISSIIVIDCMSLTQRIWDTVIDNASETIHSTGQTVFFSNIDALPISLQSSVLSYIKASNLPKRHRLIASSRVTLSINVANGLFLSELYSVINNYMINIPPLRERRKDISHMIRYMLPKYNMLHSKEIRGVAPDGVSIMEEYEWPLNFTQLMIVLNQLVTLSSTYYISAQEISQLLSNSYAEHFSSSIISYSGTLEEIEKQILEKILRDENMNQSAAARRLGIGRSTLRRKLNL